MKVKFNRSAFQEALNLVTSIVPSRTPKPILQCIKIVAAGGEVMVSATDLEVGITYAIAQVEVETDGEIVIPADKLSAIIRESNDEVIGVEAVDATINITGADSHFTVYGHDPSQYPAVQGFEGGGDLQINLGRLQEGIELTVFAAAKESTRYALNGTLWEVNGKKLTLVATDGRRLAKSIVTMEAVAANELPGGRVIIPAKTMLLLDKLVGDADTTVAVKFVDNQVVINTGQAVISSNLVEGNFPKYGDIIPGNYENKVELSVDAVLSAVRRAALLANEDSKGIKVGIKKNAMVFAGRAPETGDAQVDMVVEYDGDEIEIGFNPQFLVDVLRVIKSDTFTLELGDADRPGVIKCGSDFLYIVMPVNL